MGIADAIRMRSESLADTQNTYKQNVVAVNTLLTSVLTSKLPTLNTPPPDWTDFTTAYEQADAGALDWVNNVLARLMDVPGEVSGYNTLITDLLNDAAQQAAALVSNPGNAAALAALDQDLTGLSRQLNLVVTFISGAVSAIQQFQDNLPALVGNLHTIALKSSTDAQADQDAINQLLNDIDSLRSDISSLTAQIVALAIVDGIALTIGVVTTIALWPVGAAVWFVMGPAVIAATMTIALDAEKIKEDKAKIESDQEQITGLSADVATLQVLAQSFQALSDQTVAIEDSVQAILVEWQTLETDVNNAITDIRTASTEASGQNFSAVQTDLADAAQAWQAGIVQAGTLVLDLQVNNAPLSLGMSADEVQSALAGGTLTTDVITYYNQVGQTS
jgi:predicted  nucleic acid-binding Zn-ribbon protein